MFGGMLSYAVPGRAHFLCFMENWKAALKHSVTIVDKSANMGNAHITSWSVERY